MSLDFRRTATDSRSSRGSSKSGDGTIVGGAMVVLMGIAKAVPVVVAMVIFVTSTIVGSASTTTAVFMDAAVVVLRSGAIAVLIGGCQ